MPGPALKVAKKVDKLPVAKQLCQDWWARGLGTPGSLKAILRELSAEELDQLEDSVPLKCEGPVGNRVEGLRDLIDKVQSEK